jgi:hypothetical protein
MRIIRFEIARHQFERNIVTSHQSAFDSLQLQCAKHVLKRRKQRDGTLFNVFIRLAPDDYWHCHLHEFGDGLTEVIPVRLLGARPHCIDPPIYERARIHIGIRIVEPTFNPQALENLTRLSEGLGQRGQLVLQILPSPVEITIYKLDSMRF